MLRGASLSLFPYLSTSGRVGRVLLVAKHGFATVPAPMDIKLYQYKICPFCSKVKTVLDFFDIPYSTIEVNPLTKAEISFSKDYRKVPIADVDGVVIKDSTEIIDHILSKIQFDDAEERARFLPPPPPAAAAAAAAAPAAGTAAWADRKLAVLLFPNITRSFAEARQAFAYIQDVPTFSTPQKIANVVLGSTAMWLAQGKLKKKYGIEDERQALYSEVANLLEALGGRPFLGGAAPGVGDLAAYGVLRAVEGLDAHRETLEETGVGAWYGRVAAAVGGSAEITAAARGNT